MSKLFDGNRIKNLAKNFEDILNTFCFQTQKVNSDFYINEISYYFYDAETLFFEMVQRTFFDIRYCKECEDESYSFTFFEDKCLCGKKVSDHQNVIKLYSVKDDVRTFISNRNKDKLVRSSKSWDSNQSVLDKLKKDDRIVPFIGSGLSTPYGFPDWPSLVKQMGKYCSEDAQNGVNYFLSRRDYLSCFDAILNDKENQIIKDDSDLKKRVSELFSIRFIDLHKDSNYFDLVDMEYPLIITTNYDEIIDKIGRDYYESVIFKNVEDVKSLENIPVILHLHGLAGFQDKLSMVVTREDYESIYGKDVYKRKIQSLLGNKTILFLGYSLDDYFFMNELMRVCEANAGFVDYYAFMINVDYNLLQQRIPDYYRKVKIISLEMNLPVNSDEVIDKIRLYLKYIQNSLFLTDD